MTEQNESDTSDGYSNPLTYHTISEDHQVDIKMNILCQLIVPLFITSILVGVYIYETYRPINASETKDLSTIDLKELENPAKINIRDCKWKDINRNCIETCYGGYALQVTQEGEQVCGCKGELCTIDPCVECKDREEKMGTKEWSCPCSSLIEL